MPSRSLCAFSVGEIVRTFHPLGLHGLAQVQLAESIAVERVKRNLAESVKAGHCTVCVLFLVPIASLACITRHKVIVVEGGA